MRWKNQAMDEQRLIAACKNGESWACKSLYELYAPTMMGVCMRYVNDRETARDILQDGFVKVFTKIDTYSEKGAFAGWVRRIFVTTALEYLRNNNVLNEAVSLDDFNKEIEDTSASMLEKLSAEDLQKCIAELPNGYRTVFNLYAVEGYTHVEIAEMLQITTSTSHSQFVRARNLLQKKIRLLMQENAR